MSTSLIEALTPRLTEYIPHAPELRQRAFLVLPQREALYGGAAGGGKTDALLMAALQYVDVPGYAALLIRRTYGELAMEDSLLDRAHAWLDATDASWNGHDYRWTFPSGATLTFGYLSRDDHRFRYQSAAFQFIGWDELTQWPTDLAYRYLFSRLRRLAGSHTPLRVRAASNPGGFGHDWVKARFVVTDAPPRERVFIPATLADNPYLDQETYRLGLEELDPITREQLLRGDWDVVQGGVLFQRGWFRLVEDVPAGLRLCRYWDLAATEPSHGNPDPDWTVGALVGLDGTGSWYVLDVVRLRRSSHEVDELMRSTALLDRQRYGAVRQRVEQEPGASGKKVIADLRARVFVGSDFAGRTPGTDKVTRARPAASAAEARKVHVVLADWTERFLTELDLFPLGTHDDQVDALTGAMAELAFPLERRGGLRA